MAINNKQLKFRVHWRSMLVSGNDIYADLLPKDTPMVQCSGETIVYSENSESAYSTWKTMWPKDRIRIIQEFN